MSIDGIGPIKPVHAPMEPLKNPDISANAIKATVVNSLLGAAPTASDPTPQQQNAHNVSQAFGDLTQLYILYTNGGSQASIDALWKDLQSLFDNGKIYNGQITVNNCTFNPRDMVRDALVAARDKDGFMQGFWQKGEATGAAPLWGSNCVASFLFNTNPAFDMSFTYAPTTVEDFMNLFLIGGVASLAVRVDGMYAPLFDQLGKFWDFSFSPSMAGKLGSCFPEMIAAGLYARDVVNGTGTDAEKWQRFNDDLSMISKTFSADKTKWNNPTFTNLAFDGFQALVARLRTQPPTPYTSWLAVATALGTPGAVYDKIVSGIQQTWDKWRHPNQ
jgi:hypothetical protein